MNVLKTLLLGLLFLVIAFFQPCLAEDDIGLYFDATGSINCLPDFTSFPQAQEVYLVLKDCSATGGVGGWEGAFSLPPGCFITSSNLGPESINVGVSPEYIVGFGSPIPQASTIVLASFSFFFTSPGEIYFHAPEQNSMEGVFGPLYVEGGGTDLLIPMNYSFGSPFHPITSIGMETCPLDSIFQDQNIPENPDWEIVSPVEKVFSDSGCGTSGKTSIPDDWSVFFRNWDIGLMGTIEDIEVDCFLDGENRIGATKLTINAQEVFWGAAPQIFEIWFKGTAVPGCVDYDDYLTFSLLSDLTLGQEIVVFTGHRDGVFHSSKWGIFVFQEDKSNSGFTKENYQDLIQLGHKHSIVNQVKDADLAVLLEPQNSKDGLFKVKVVYVGDHDMIGKKIKIIDSSIMGAISKFEESPPLLLGLLKRTSSGDFTLIHGRKSFFLSTRRGWTTSSGYRIDVLRVLGKGVE